MRTAEISFLTPGRIAAELGVPLLRVPYVLGTRPHIRPAVRTGSLRTYFPATIAQARHELAAIDSHQARRGA